MAKKVPDGEVMEGARPFYDFLREVGRGRLHDELTETLNQLIGEVRATGRKGELAVVFKFAPAGDDQMGVEASLKVKRPQTEGYGNIFFVSDGNNLHRSDPRQNALPLSVVRGADVVDPSTGEILKEGAI